MELFVEISSATPQAGGAESEFPAWIIVVLEIARPTRMDQGTWDWASWAGGPGFGFLGYGLGG